MKKWIGKEYSSSGRYELHFGEKTSSRAVLYHESIDGKWEYNFSVCDGGVAYDHVALNAQTLNEAKIELEKWLEELFLKRISEMEDGIVRYKQWIIMLNSDEGKVDKVDA